MNSANSHTMEDRVTTAALKLEEWVRTRNWQGYDPYDIPGTTCYRFFAQHRSLLVRGFGWPVLRFLVHFPKTTRLLFGIRPRWNAKAQGLFLSAYVRLAALRTEPQWLDYAHQCARTLLANRQPGYAGSCWGYPFDWQSVIFIPKGTPSVVVSTAVGAGFWDLYQHSHDGQWLDVCRDIARFVTKDLNVARVESGQVCFSYTPLDQYRVHNANLMAAEFLVRVGNECGESDWVELGLEAARYTLSDQLEDGSLYYWGRGWPNRSHHRDIYHSGFEIRSLWGLWRSTGDRVFLDAAGRYLDFFQKAYFRDDGMPVRMPFEFDHPTVNIHGCAEAILCPATVLPDFPAMRETLESSAAWSLTHMQNADGSWAHQINPSGPIDRTLYMRWGQAWMFRALVEYLAVCKGRYEP